MRIKKIEKKLQILIVISVISLWLTGIASSSAQLDDEEFDYEKTGYLFHIMLESASDLLSSLTDAPNSEYQKEIQTSDGREEWIQMSSDEIDSFNLKELRYALDQIDSSFGILSDTIPQSQNFHSIVNEAKSLKENDKFEESLAKYKSALDSYEKWFELTVEKNSKVDGSLDDEINQEIIQPSTKQDGGGCLIATATYGSEMSSQVQQLRELRDNSLLNTESGTSFMNTFNGIYYSFSPVIADYERENPVFKEAVKLTLTPLITSLSILNHVDMDSESSVLGYGMLLIILNGMMYFVAPVIVISKISHTISKRRTLA